MQTVGRKSCILRQKEGRKNDTAVPERVVLPQVSCGSGDPTVPGGAGALHTLLLRLHQQGGGGQAGPGMQGESLLVATFESSKFYILYFYFTLLAGVMEFL